MSKTPTKKSTGTRKVAKSTSTATPAKSKTTKAAAAKPVTKPRAKPASAKAPTSKTAAKSAPKTAAKSTPTTATAKSPMPSKPKAPAGIVAKPAVVEAATAVVSGPALRKKELVEKIVLQTGLKKRDVRPVVETMLSVLGEAIAEDRELNLPPFGKLRIQRVKQLPTARVTVAKLRQAMPDAGTKEAAE